MEKFGIFELLDALSAFSATADTAPPPEQHEEEPPASEQKKRTPDAAFAPPSYGGQMPAPTPTEGSAYSAFLERHERAKGKVKR